MVAVIAPKIISDNRICLFLFYIYTMLYKTSNGNKLDLTPIYLDQISIINLFIGTTCTSGLWPPVSIFDKLKSRVRTSVRTYFCIHRFVRKGAKQARRLL